MKAFLHIGTAKTATTTIQSFLGANSRLLLGKGCIVTTSAGKDNNLYLAVAAYDSTRRDELTRLNQIYSNQQLADLKKQITSDLRSEINHHRSSNNNADKIIFSSEYIHLLLKTPNELNRLKTVLHNIGIDDIEIIVYLRKPSALANSYFSTSVKTGVTHGSPQPPEQERYEHLCHHKNTLLRFADVFGKNKVTARVFEKPELKNGSIVDDFLQLVGIEHDSNFEFPYNLNESLSSHGVNIQRLLNRVFPRWIGDELNPLVPLLVKRVAKAYPGRSSEMPDALRKQYELYFKDSNEWVCKKYFPQKSNLFNDENFNDISGNFPDMFDKAGLEKHAEELALDLLREISNEPIRRLWNLSSQVPATYGNYSFEAKRYSFQQLVNLSIGASQYHLGLIKTALDRFNIVLKEDSKNIEALIFKSMCLSELDDDKAADKLYFRILCMQPENLRALKLYATSAEKQGLQHAAEIRWSNILVQHPGHEQALFKAGLCQLKQNKFSDALTNFDKFLETNSEHESATYFRGRCLNELVL